MSNWRELGYVPNSDDEDSDGALSTQEDTIPGDLGPKNGSDIGIENADSSPRGELVGGKEGMVVELGGSDMVAAAQYVGPVEVISVLSNVAGLELTFY